MPKFPGLKLPSDPLPWPPAKLRSMRAFLATWYLAARRDLPWRRTRDPYAITVSELMLQQTQVVTVIPYYDRWLKVFPTWTALAQAPEAAVLKAWEGLGYYRRARNLQALARAVIIAGGALPKTEIGLRALPGIGPYTAAAVGSIAFGLPLAVLDGNVMRVLTRLLASYDDISRRQTRDKLQLLATVFLDKSDPPTHNQALMELGATICLPRKPMCLICPLKHDCAGRDHAEDFPVRSRVEIIKRLETIAILREDHRLYCEQVPAGKPWHGLWRFPDFDPERMEEGEPLVQLKYGITKYAVTLRAIAAHWKSGTTAPGNYLTREEMQIVAFAAPHRKLLRLLQFF
jgi:A/G-specific adenine glycosylase